MSSSLWVFQVLGGEPFHTQVGGNPSVDHDGGTSVFHLVLTEPEAQNFRHVVKQLGCEMVVRPSRRQSAAQEKERSALLGVGKKGTAWPSHKCPTCYWFDPAAEEDPCGFTGWPEETRRVSLENPKAKRDWDECPVSRS